MGKCVFLCFIYIKESMIILPFCEKHIKYNMWAKLRFMIRKKTKKYNMWAKLRFMIRKKKTKNTLKTKNTFSHSRTYNEPHMFFFLRTFPYVSRWTMLRCSKRKQTGCSRKGQMPDMIIIILFSGKGGGVGYEKGFSWFFGEFWLNLAYKGEYFFYNAFPLSFGLTSSVF